MRQSGWKGIDRAHVRIFDPQYGDDMRLPADVAKENAWFSSLDSNCVAIDASWRSKFVIGRIPIGEFRAENLEPMFAMYNHWFANVYPLTELRERKVLAGASGISVGDAMFARLSPGCDSIRLFLCDLNERGRIGEWTIGAARRYIDTSNARAMNKARESTDLFYFLFQFESIGALWSLNFDSGELFICFRVFKNYRSTIGSIMRDLNPP